MVILITIATKVTVINKNNNKTINQRKNIKKYINFAEF